jgi:hypothetical protein
LGFGFVVVVKLDFSTVKNHVLGCFAQSLLNVRVSKGSEVVNRFAVFLP